MNNEVFFSPIQNWKNYFSSRKGESKLGDVLPFNDSKDKVRFHILGVCESIGPRLNGGFAGTENAFPAFLKRFLSIQANEFIPYNEIKIHGHLYFKDDELSEDKIKNLDDYLLNWSLNIFENGGIPIVIGGGHNNCLGLINGMSAYKKQKVNVINCDPHADIRNLESRHSGNGFSYAIENQVLDKYAVIGLHESYNNQFILNELKKINYFARFFDDCFDDNSLFHKHIDEAIAFVSEEKFGMELDMDSIAYMPSSAFTPSGISLEQARMYIRKVAKNVNASYLHLPEAAPKNEQEELIVGKALAYLVSDFIKAKL